ncbi:MAG: SURF1 family protein [Gemmatimonadota bacterium]|nr:SURF1 family protein [Gemmatimonadota bacterium]
MRRPIRDYVLTVLAAGFVITTTSLGFWQLRRLAQRRAQNAKVVARLAEPAVPVAQLSHDSAALHYRRVLLRGTWDYAHQVKVAERSRDGSPGVNIVTPLRIAGTDTAVLVNRGWVYAPDGITVDLSGWREADTLAGTGYARPLSKPFPGSPVLPGRPDAFRWLDLGALKSRIPYAVYPFVIVLDGDDASQGSVPPRIPPPPLDEGPHRSYAIQWFSFAIIAIVGMFFFLRGPPTDEIGRIVQHRTGSKRG